jgi:hypothetical protein
VKVHAPIQVASNIAVFLNPFTEGKLIMFVEILDIQFTMESLIAVEGGIEKFHRENATLEVVHSLIVINLDKRPINLYLLQSLMTLENLL